MAINNRLALGTVQFGLPYGIANQSGQVTREEASAILDYAWSNGINTLDTAIAYGDSEQRLGEIGVAGWQVISKLPALPDPCKDVTRWVNESVIGSLDRLGISKLRGLLLHRPQQLLEKHGQALYAALDKLKAEGLVEKIGVSIYDPEELNVLWPQFHLDIIQAPFNVIDRRLVTSGWLKRLYQAGVEVHVRSLFLQGLLLMEPKQLPDNFRQWQPLWQRWHAWLDEEEISPLQACLGFVRAQAEIGRMVIGVDSLTQLQEILNAIVRPTVNPPVDLMSENKELVDPKNWNLK